MDRIEFTNPESKELNEEVRNYLELMRDTEALIGDGMEKLKGANWAKLWSSLDKLVFYPKTYEGNLAIFKTRCDIRYVSLFTKPDFAVIRKQTLSWAASLDHGLMMVRNVAIRFLLTRPLMNFGDMPFLSIQIRSILRL